MDKRTSPAFAACAECGAASSDRLICEHCFLDTRKRLGGLIKDDP